MAELQSQTGSNRRKGGVRRSKKLSTKVDLTPMVDLGFLLITFFIITTTWSESKAMHFLMPKGDRADMPVPASTALTVIPIGNNQLFYYHGDFTESMPSTSFGITGYTVDSGIGEIIRKKQLQLNSTQRFSSKDLMLVIKPSSDASYKNVVDVMDEVLINGITHYAVADLTKAEQDFLAKYAGQ